MFWELYKKINYLAAALTGYYRETYSYRGRITGNIIHPSRYASLSGCDSVCLSSCVRLINTIIVELRPLLYLIVRIAI